jgi:hypothetical protein
MSRRLRSLIRRQQRGIAAIELAIILPVMLLFLTIPLFFGRVFWHYTVAQKAAHDAARYLSGVSLAQMAAPSQVGHVVAVAQAIAAAEMSDLNPGPYSPVVTIQCDGITCDGFMMPAVIRVVVRMPMYDGIFSAFTSDIAGASGLLLTADVTMRYVQD